MLSGIPIDTHLRFYSFEKIPCDGCRPILVVWQSFHNSTMTVHNEMTVVFDENQRLRNLVDFGYPIQTGFELAFFDGRCRLLFQELKLFLLAEKIVFLIKNINYLRS